MKAFQKHSSRHPSRQEEDSLAVRWVRPVLIGAIVGVVCCLIALLLCAAIMAAQDIPQMAVTPMAVMAAALGAFAGGLVAGKLAKTRGILYGAACGGVLYLLVMIAGFAVLQDIRGVYALVKLAVMIGCGAVGGIVGANLRRR